MSKLPPLPPLPDDDDGQDGLLKEAMTEYAKAYGAACRAAALEEAAKLFDRGGKTVGKNIAASIRALKEKKE